MRRSRVTGACRQCLTVLGGVVALLTASSATAQDAGQAQAQAEHARRLAANPEGLSLAIRTQRGTLRFAQGELITLELEFRDDSGNRYRFNPIAYDRSGRLGVDRVVVAPAADVEDPLHDYYRALGFGFIGGGISSLPAPLDGPRTLSLELNEQVRFQRPGQYGIHVESGRFEGGGRGAAHERLIVVSNLLTLEITAPAAEEPTETLAARALRFADTPRAARELARRLLRLEGDANRFGTDGHEIRFGLFSTRYRAEALAVVRRELMAASRPVHDAVPTVAAFLEVMTALPRDTSDDDPAAGEDAERMRRYQCLVAFWQQQALAAGLRGGPADVAHASVAFTEDAPPHCPALPAVNVARVLPPVFDHLSPADQRRMLTYRWGHVAGAAMLPVLRQLLEAPGLQQEAGDDALVRLGELASAEAARVSREDVATGRFRFSAQALRLRPADTPLVTASVMQHLARARDQSTALSDLQDGAGTASRGLLPTAVRLASPHVCGALEDWPSRSVVSCAARASVVACALAVDASRGASAARKALDYASSRCRDSLPETLALVWPQRLPQDVLREALWHADASVAASAARALARVGDADARVALWRRLDEWHAMWKGREHEFRLARPTLDDPVTQALGLERALREGLLRGRGWLTSADDRLRVRDSCLTDACRTEFSPFAGGPPHRLVLVQAEEWTGQTVYRVDGHAFSTLEDVVERLSLYPKTVTMAWHAGASHAAARADVLYKALAEFATTCGVTVLARPPKVQP
jgi:hypothetical protein